MKPCKGCSRTLPFAEFYANPNVKDGHLNYCKPCVIARYAAGRTARKDRLLRYIQAIKVERGCADCGFRGHPAALDFDHLPGHTKVIKMSSAASGVSRARLEAEIAKCEVVCANCHRIRTAIRRSSPEAAAS